MPMARYRTCAARLRRASGSRLSLLFERKAAADGGPTALAEELERSVQGAHPLMHARQASAEAGPLRQADAVIGDFDDDLPCLDSRRYGHGCRVGVLEHI